MQISRFVSLATFGAALFGASLIFGSLGCGSDDDNNNGADLIETLCGELANLNCDVKITKEDCVKAANANREKCPAEMDAAVKCQSAHGHAECVADDPAGHDKTTSPKWVVDKGACQAENDAFTKCIMEKNQQQ